MKRRLERAFAGALASADVDYLQWRALTRTMLRTDLRTTGAVGVQFGADRSQNLSGRLIMQAVTALLMGGAMAIVVFVVDDVMLSGTLALTVVMFMAGLMILVDHQSVITSPDDYMVLGWRPVSSRTYFAVRLTNVLIYAWGVTTMYGLLPMLAFGVAGGFQPLRGLAAMFAFYLAATFTALALVMSYASLIRFVGARRLARIMSYAQLVIGVLMYGGYMLPSQMMRLKHLQSSWPDTPWLLLFPPTWFASYLAMAEGTIGLRQILPAAGSIVALALIAIGLSGRLSLDYASRLGAMLSATAETSTPVAGGRRTPWLFRTGEHRVVSLLIRAQFRHDQKFRMAVLGVLPLTILYMLFTFQDGPPADPFAGEVGKMSSWAPLTMAVLFFPVMLRTTLTMSDAYKAAWIYFGTPVSRARILRAQTDVLTASFVVPYVCTVGAVMGYFTGSPMGVFTHILFIALFGRLLLQALTVGSPVMPFSRPTQKMAQSSGFMGWFFVAMIFGWTIGPLFVWLVYPSWIRIVGVLIALLAMSVALDRLTRVRLGESAEQLEFEGGT